MFRRLRLFWSRVRAYCRGAWIGLTRPKIAVEAGPLRAEIIACDDCEDLAHGRVSLCEKHSEEYEELMASVEKAD